MTPQIGNGAQIHFINGEVTGVSFGSDATTEHGCGINPLHLQLGVAAGHVEGRQQRTDFQKWKEAKEQKTLKGYARRLFGVDPQIPPMGMDKRYITKLPSSLRWVEKDGNAGFLCYSREFAITALVEKFAGYLDRRDLACGWSDEGFIALAKGQDNIDRLRVVFDAVQRKDAVIGSFSVPQHRGIAILIASRVPDSTRAVMLDQDREAFELEKRVDATGIVNYVEAAGKRFSALGKGSVDGNNVLSIWLNPYDQDKYNFGWFTVEELQQWCEDKGPVIKTRPARNRR